MPASLVGQNGRYVGFGADDVAAKGKRHSEPARVEAVRPDVVEMTSSRIPCHGDSGGPLLVPLGGRETIIGVGHTTLSDDSGHCTMSATYTRTDLFADFVRSAL